MQPTFTNFEHRNGSGQITSLEVTGDITWKRSVRRNSVDPSDGVKPGTRILLGSDQVCRLKPVGSPSSFPLWTRQVVIGPSSFRGDCSDEERNENTDRIYRAGVIERKSRRRGIQFFRSECRSYSVNPRSRCSAGWGRKGEGFMSRGTMHGEQRLGERA